MAQAKTAPVRLITKAEARGNSRPVSETEFRALHAEGRQRLARMDSDRRPISGLDQHWDKVKAASYAEARKSWGGATIDPRTGQPLSQGADRYALTAKPPGLDKVSVPETASQAEFAAAMDQAKEQFRPELEKGSRYLGVFHDDDNHRIDMDPVVVVSSRREVEAIGAHTHAVGGAYHFKTGDGYFPPHVAEGGSSG